MTGPDLSDDVPLLVEQYRIPGLRQIGLMPTTGRNVNAIMVDAQGGRYVLRCYLRNVDHSRIQFQLDFQEHLLGKGIPTADIIATNDGERLVNTGQRTWVLFRQVAGAGYDYANSEQLRNAALCLADLHEAAEDFAEPAVDDDTIPSLRRWWTHGAEDLAELHTMFADRDVAAELAFLDAWLASLTRDFPIEVVDQLPPAWVHADFHGTNLAFVDDQVTGVFDFDVVHRGYRLEDVAHATFCFSREDATSNRIRPELSAAFQEHFNLTDLERAALPAFTVATQARNAARYRIREREGADPAAVLRGHVARMRHLCGLAP
ncbi:phosphotransferase [Actinopolymorpha sp. B17G11]|uniref:phosphotransferase enzyme family protein n=1 Tax=Actinopolymorpha sp. B17G11 TaxID=3160861 RepID=UPI0032E3FA08